MPPLLQAVKHKYFSALPYPTLPAQLPLPTSHVARVLAPELEQKKPKPQGKRAEGMPAPTGDASAAGGGRKRKSTGEGESGGDENNPAPRRVARKLDFGA